MKKYIDINDVYPIGSIYLSVNNINPSTLFGGSWEQIKDRFLLAAGNIYDAGSMGGNATHVIERNELPERTIFSLQNQTGKTINLSGSFGWKNGTVDANKYCATCNYDARSAGLQNFVGGDAMNIMPPYLAIYIWKRIE